MSKNRNGITLIALVVTIIVLLILAGVSIITLTGDNGIITRTEKVKKTTEEAAIKENISLAYAHAQIGKYAGKNETFADEIKKDLENTYGTGSATVVANEGGTYSVTLNGKTYYIDANGNVTNLPTGFTIGSTVTYKPSGTSTWKAELCSSTKTITDDVSLQTVASGSVDSGKTNMSITSWRVLSIDEENNKVELISTAPSPNAVYLGEAQGYNNGVYLLNKACNELYGGTITKGGTQYTITGRNVNINDIEDRMTDTALNDNSTGAHKFSNGTVAYGNQYSSAFTGSKNYPLIYVQESKSVINGNEKTSGIGLSDEGVTPIHRGDSVSEPQQLQEGKATPTTTSKRANNDGMVTATTSIKPYQTHWRKDNNFMKKAFKAPTELNDTETDGTQNTNYSLLMTDGTNPTTYWVASRCVDVFSGLCYFNVSGVFSGSVGAANMYESRNRTSQGRWALRPVVSLSSDLISGNSTSGFKVE